MPANLLPSGFANPKKLGARCGECPFACNGQAQKPVYMVGADGPPQGLLLGESPGQVEAAQGEPFVGPTGEQLNVELVNAGLVRDRLVVGNAILCQPPEGKKNEANMRRAVEACAPAFVRQLEQLGVWSKGGISRPALAMGKWAFFALTGKVRGVEKARGFVRQLGWSKVVLTWHPTYAFFRNPYAWGDLELDLKRFNRLTRVEVLYGISRPVYQNDLAAIRALVLDDRPISCDIETGAETPQEPWTGKDPTRAKLKTIAFGNTAFAVAFEWAAASSTVRANIAALVSNRKMVWQNGPWFDHRVLRRYGFLIDEYEDTRDARKALVATSRLNLGYMACVYDDPPPWKEDEEGDDAKGMIHTKDMGKLLHYNGIDTIEQARVWDGITREPEWNDTRVQRLYHYNKRMSEVAARMHTTGFMVDRVERVKLVAELTKMSVDRRAAFATALGTDGAKPSPNLIRSIIYARYKTKGVLNFNLPDPIDDEDWTETGLIVVDQASLLKVFINPHVPDALKKIIETYWHASAPQKALSTFVVSEKVEQAIGKDGRLRPGWNSLGTDTGRWSCSEPNIMNLSEKKTEVGGSLSGDLPNIRRMYRAAPKRVLVHADYSKQELRVRVAVMGDKQLEEDLKYVDPHPTEKVNGLYAKNARDWFGVHADQEVKYEAYHSCKQIHLGKQYGAGKAKVHELCLKRDRLFKWALTDRLCDKFDATYVATVAFWHEELDRVCRVGYSETRVLGRRRYYPRQPDMTETANFPVQGTAADFTILALDELDKVFPADERGGPQLVGQLHDAIDIECSEADGPVVARVVREIMEAPRFISGYGLLSIPVDVKIAETWDKV